MKMYPDNNEAEDICFKIACESFELKWVGTSKPINLEIECVNELGIGLNVDIANTEVKECDEVVNTWMQQEREFARRGI